MSVNQEHFAKQRQLAASLFNQGKLPEAKEVCERLCARQEDAGVYCLLGAIWSRLAQFGLAAKFCHRAIELAPEYLDAYEYLGFALRRLNDFSGACAALEFVLQRRPEAIEVRYQLGLARESAGELQQALDAFRAIRHINPAYLNAVAGEASVHDRMGAPERALDVLRPHLGKQLRNTQVAVQYGRIARGLGQQRDAVDMLEPLVADAIFPAEERLQIHFTLGALLDDLGEYDRAFAHYQQANKLKDVRFDVRNFAGLVDTLETRFSRSTIGGAARATNHSLRPVFVVGMPRSGTSLTEQILASHPDVFGAGELVYVNGIVSSLEQARMDISGFTADQLDEAAAAYLDAISRLNDISKRVVDKLPANFLNLGYIDMLFPGARVIHCRRDPLDTCLSCYMQNFSPVHAYSFNLEHAASYYLGYQRLMEHWKQTIRLPILEVDYEQLVADPERQTRQLIEFLDLPWDSRCLQFHASERVANTASYDQVRQPMYLRSAGRWRNYESHLGSLQELLGSGEAPSA